ncbi:MAG: DUF6712 family protein [Saprospiraceae bacterium]
MKLVFKLTSEDSSEISVGHSNFKLHYPEVNTSMAFATLEPRIRQATRQYILPHIGSELYDSIATKFNDDTALAGLEEEFLELLQDAVAPYTIMKALPLLNMVISDMGAMENQAKEGTGGPVSQWRFKNALWAATLQAHKSLDQLLAFMETNKAEALFADWAASESYMEARSAFFSSTKQLNSFLNIQDSRTSYVAMLPSIRKAEQKHIQPVIGRAQFDSLAAKIKSGDALTNIEKDLFAHIERTTAEYSLVLGAAHLTLVIEGDGFKIIGSGDMFEDKRNLTNNTHSTAIAQLKDQAQSDGQTFKADLIAFLYSNAESFPLFKNSEAYRPAGTNSRDITCRGAGGIWI